MAEKNIIPNARIEEATALFFSPHLDDAVFSCGGQLAALIERGERPLVATCFTETHQPGEPVSQVIRELHKIWNMGEDDEAVARFWRGRREEDAVALESLGVPYVWLPYRDAIYRGGQYYSRETIMNHVQPGDWELFERLSAHAVELWRRTARAVVYLPLGIGNHIDHQLVFMLAGALRQAGAEIWHYEDFPYVAREPRALGLRLAELGAPYRSRTVDITAQIERRLEATALYGSQMTSTFRNVGPYREVTMRYASSVAGAEHRYAERLWALDRDGHSVR